MLFDWHGTLVDTFDGMYDAVDDMLSRLGETGLLSRLAQPEQFRSEAHARLWSSVREHHRLPPEVRTERRIARTDIFELLFGGDEQAKDTAHQLFAHCYRAHFGEATPLESETGEVLRRIRHLGIRLGVVTNRNREFLSAELEQLERGTWRSLFDVVVCGDYLAQRKPHPHILLSALDRLGASPGPEVWYVGDASSDTVSAKRAGLTNAFFNEAGRDAQALESLFRLEPEGLRPDLVVSGIDELHGRLAALHARAGRSRRATARRRVTENPPRLPRPEVVLFDWHATLADTLDAMYQSVDEVLPRLEQLGLLDRLVAPGQSKTPEDGRLVDFVRAERRLHPKIRAQRKISRTDIFEVLFGEDAEAKRIAHEAFNECYRHNYGQVRPFEPGARPMLELLRRIALKVGLLTNREREFFEDELERIEPGGWSHLFDVTICGNDTTRRKPAPDSVLLALRRLGTPPDRRTWYVGDSTTDVIAAQDAGVTAVFYNGARWDDDWLARIFPGTERHPHQPDAVVDDFAELTSLIEAS